MRATALIPTHDHAEMLELSLRSALAQTVEDIEVFVVGDGAPEQTRDLVAGIGDPRVRYFDFPKGPRHGEVHRHQALLQASGDIICYLCDDDLWLPEHVEVLEQLLEPGYHFAHTLPVTVGPLGHLDVKAVDLSRPEYREAYLCGANEVSPTYAGHTRGAYNSLPFGWRTTPDDVPTDLYMWQQFLREPWCLATSSWRFTSLHFPSPQRREMTDAARLEELTEWSRRVAEPGAIAAIERVLLARAAELHAAASAPSRLPAADRPKFGSQSGQ